MWQSDESMGCLSENVCTANEMDTQNTGLLEEEADCTWDSETGLSRESQYLTDLIDRQRYYERGVDMRGVEDMSYTDLHRTLREFGL